MNVPADFQPGVYRHWRGQHYLVLGLASDSTNEKLFRHDSDTWGDTVATPPRYLPVGDRLVVVYVGLDTEGRSHPSVPLHVRDLDEFLQWVHDDGRPCPGCPHAQHTRRFTYVGQVF